MTTSSRSDPRPSPEADERAGLVLQKALAGAQALMDEGRLDEALERLEALAQRHHDHAPVFNKMGICLARLGRLAEAARAFERAAQLDPAYPAPWSNLGNVRLQEGRLEEAEAAYRRALAIDPDYAPAHNNLAAALRRMGRYDEAVHHLKQSVRLQRDALDSTGRPVASRWLAYGMLGLAALLYWIWRQRGALVAMLAAAAWVVACATSPPTAAARPAGETLVVVAGSVRLEVTADSLGLRLVTTRPAAGPDAGRSLLAETEPAVRVEGPEPEALERLAARLDGLAGEPSIEPRVRVEEPGRAVIVPGRPGRRVDRGGLARELRAALQQGGLRPVEVPWETVAPSLTEAELEPLKSPRLLGAYVTRYDPLEQERAVNLALAAQALDGLVLRPGATFSFNEVVGPRVRERGYKEAPVLVNGRFTLDIGGGVCQTSTTLYNAALLSGLQARVRAPHSRPVWYVPLARDAAVAWGLIDLKLENSHPYPVAISARADGDELVVRLWAPSDAVALPWQLRTVVERATPAPVERRIDPSLAPGEGRLEEEGRTGYVATLWRELPLYGPAVGRQRVNVSSYPPAAAVMRVGSAEATSASVR